MTPYFHLCLAMPVSAWVGTTRYISIVHGWYNKATVEHLSVGYSYSNNLPTMAAPSKGVRNVGDHTANVLGS